MKNTEKKLQICGSVDQSERSILGPKKWGGQKWGGPEKL
jgi:hypothetical protein